MYTGPGPQQSGSVFTSADYRGGLLFTAARISVCADTTARNLTALYM